MGRAADGYVGPATKASLYNLPAPVTPPSQGTSLYAAVVSLAQDATQQYIPYAWDGGKDSNPGPTYGSCALYTGAINPCPAGNTVGLDCSGFTRWIYRQADAGDIGLATDNQIANPGSTRSTGPRPSPATWCSSAPTRAPRSTSASTPEPSTAYR
ncbi:hypothetical protein AB0A71_31730 [Kitasatospora aureofaciens]|uniref:hypothetical protein n=1 Tax=Kitasatospora aureofaciens TaxID=1894 RepID=UPI0033E1AC0A